MWGLIKLVSLVIENKYMRRILLLTGIALIIMSQAFKQTEKGENWIRINQLGYTPKGIKEAVWCSKSNTLPEEVELVDDATKKIVYTVKQLKAFGSYGPFNQTSRIRFTDFKVNGRYFLRAGNTQSPVFAINDTVYKGAADFCLRYMRQQRSGFNPYLKDSCHTRDGYTLYGPMPDSTYINVSGGWHDASDYLQYTTTSANAAWHLLEAYKNFGEVFGDEKRANGLDGKNGIADILDEAKWGLDWLLKMNPAENIMFNQLGDDRDHMKMRIPKEDTNYYGRGIERPVYFVSGKPQVRGKFMNATTGTASTAAKFASTFALAAQVYQERDAAFSKKLIQKAEAAYGYGKKYPGVAQTASVRSPYIYAEGNWTDDMELAAATLAQTKGVKVETYTEDAYTFAIQEPVTPWLGKDTANHYEWYPFVNAGHFVLAYGAVSSNKRDSLHDFYEAGIKAVWNKAKQNAFYRGIPFIWCSNNLTTSFAIQCYWYRIMTGDKTYAALEQANIDWLFGCNPWGTSMVYGLPSWGDTPADPHSAFTHLKKYPIDGGLVDGPVYTSIYKNLIGITLNEPDEYAAFQSDLAVYHDDYGDYSTNEPTMDGTASLIYLLAAKEHETRPIAGNGWTAYPPVNPDFTMEELAIVRGDVSKKSIALVFTADEYAEGLPAISKTLDEQNIKASFFFTGRLYRNKQYQTAIKQLFQKQHYLGPHSDQHILYNDWNNRDSMLVTRDSLERDYNTNLQAMKDIGVENNSPFSYFIPPYEWWNKRIGKWYAEQLVRLFSFTPGTRTNADYTWPEMGAAYKSSETLIKLLREFEAKETLNGAILLIHAGTDPRRKDKLYNQLSSIINELKAKGYTFCTIDKL